MILKNTQISSLDEIKRSIPSYWLDFDDYMAIQRFVADEMDDFAVSALKIIDNFFIFRADEDTITDIQKFIGVYDIKDHIVDRNIYINGVLTAIGKLSVSKLTRWIEGVIGERPVIYFEPDDNGNRIMHIEVGNHPELLNDLIVLISHRLPAHLCVQYDVITDANLYLGAAAVIEMETEMPYREYATYDDIQELTYEQLAEQTYKQILYGEE